MSFKTIVSCNLAGGHTWSLQRDTEGERVLVVHEVSTASGRETTSYEVDAFRSKFKGSPQEKELQRLLDARRKDAGDA